ncbi:MAG: isoleucine--tRNA ligase, partial [Candidatus Zambryskibacteria bacterium CG10_big_fil_rev_8_21_14_0_10_34_34]
FHDGPPFATGAPHYGHLVGSVMKDVIPRYQTMKGRFVERQWGWDTHGLPIENIVEKELGTKSKKEIEEIGIGKFNNLCREKIFTYIDVWNKFIPRFGRWVNMDNPYITMESTYMESEWWAFKELFNKGLIYKDYRSMHICPRCETTLAQAEVAEGYKDIKDIAVIAKFELVNEPNTFVLAWTTTPWTLPGNVALAVGEDIDYIQNKDNLIFAKNLLEKIEGVSKEIKKEFKGKELLGKSYKPLFDDYYNDEKLPNRKNGWKIYAADFVTVESGTGVVHIAPAFGEDDMELGKKEKLPFVQHVWMDGIIRPEVKELAGLSVKPKDDSQKTDVEVLKILAQKGLLFSKEKYEHSYPHCWRCETPLLNYATSSWFVSVTKIKKDLLKYAENINWQPKHLKEGRSHDWLENARDWSISRQRFWANTIPVWENEKTEERLVIGSVAELQKYTKKSGNKYFIMRHAEAEQNLTDLINADIKNVFHLTEEGKKQATVAAQDIKSEKINLIISSPFDRCKETVAIIQKALDLDDDKVIYDEKIAELQAGAEYEGKTWTDYLKFFKNHKERFEKAPIGGETLRDINKRAGDFLYRLEKEYVDKNILIVSHDGVLKAFQDVSVGADFKTHIKMKEELGYKSKYAEYRKLNFTPLPHNENYELDLHRPYIDEVELVDDKGRVFKRVTDVLDTWFDSGSVPFSSYHYPFENKEEVEARIPADFIAEGLDQISKWFYYQHVFSTGLFGKQIFNNVIVNGIVLAEDGKKMSKRLQNYTDPAIIVDKYGADSLRYYLISTPVVKAEDLNFSEKGVAEISKKVISKLENVLSFYEMYRPATEIAEFESKKPIQLKAHHILDKWILIRLNEFHREVTTSLDDFNIYNATRPILDFIDDLSTWYIRRSRDRFKSEDIEDAVSIKDRNNALATTHYVLLNLSKHMAPFVPFFAENIYLKLKSAEAPESVHLCDWPKDGEVDEEILQNMIEVRKIVSIALEKRMSSGIKVRQPLSELKIKNKKLEGKEEYLKLIKDEINIKNITFDNKLEEEVELDTKITLELKKEGNTRDLIRAIQILRKEKILAPSDKIKLLIETNEAGKEFFSSVLKEIKKPTNIEEVLFTENDGGEIDIDRLKFKLKIK